MEITQPSSGGGGGSGRTLTLEIPVGTTDGSNTIYTVLNQPVLLFGDGVAKFTTLNYTYSAGTITWTDGSPPANSIRSYYNA